MGWATDYLADKIGNHVLNGVPFTPPTQYYLGLGYESAGVSVEFSGSGYARVAVNFTEIVQPGWGYANQEVSFPVATAAWPLLFSLMVFDAATGGNWCFEHSPLKFPRTVQAGQRLKIAHGNSYVISIPGAPDSYKTQVYSWLFSGGAAIPLGPVQVGLSDTNKTEFTAANGYSRKSPSWTSLGGGDFRNSADIVWTATGAWSPAAPPRYVGLFNAGSGNLLTWGSVGDDPATNNPIASPIVSGDVVKYSTNIATTQRLMINF